MANTLKFGNGEWYGKKDTILAYNDLNSNYKPLPFNFSRDSKATVVNKDGLIEEVGSGQPRVDYNDDSKGALLLEPSRTNFFLFSEYFLSGAWTKENSTIVSDSSISPDGNLNATKLTSNTSNGLIRASYDSSIGVDHTFSFFIKNDNSLSSDITIRASSTVVNSTINWTNNVLTSISNGVGITDFESYGNGWYRVFTSYVSIEAQQRCKIYASRNGDGASVYIYGAQIEQGSYATSYIPTSGSAVTRLADSCSQTTPDGVIGQTEGTFFIEIGKKTTSSIDLFECGQGSSQHRFLVYTDASSKLKVLVVNNYSVQVNYTSSVNVESNAKIAIGYANNNYAIYLNGSLLITDTSATVPPMNQIAIGSDRGAIVYRLNQIKDLKLYNTRLSNSELAALTQV